MYKSCSLALLSDERAQTEKPKPMIVAVFNSPVGPRQKPETDCAPQFLLTNEWRSSQ
jgi:hypothetical protein